MLKQFNSNSKKLNRVVPKVNVNNLNNTDLTGSLQNIQIPNNTKFESKTRSNLNSIKLVNNKTKISDFYQEILENSARYNQKVIDEFDNNANTLTIYNVTLDYGTEGASPNNFEVLVFGLHIPGNYTIKEVGNNVVITLNEQYIDYDNVTINDIYVMGKLKE
jgi:TRAP-type mannitol/chloroaromatic compound transport system substrate-binding protein